MHVTFYTQSMFESLVDAMAELDQYYFQEEAASLQAIREGLANGMLAEDSGVQLVVATHQGRVAGLATISLLYPAPEQRAQLFMKDLFVCRSWRGGGVGAKIMEFLASYAVSKNCVRFDWTTEKTNTRAMAFYEHLGAKPVQEKVYYRLTEEAIKNLAQGGPLHSAQ
jgi:GNAT superfamily N-acetyltransferase